jgi:hypothetical protein
MTLVALLAAACGSTSTESVIGPEEPKCSVSLAPPDGSLAASGGTGAVTVTTTPECEWTAASEATWITELSPARGQGSGPVQFRALPNASAISRESAIGINGQRAVIRQDGACQFDASIGQSQFPSSGGAGNLTISAQSGCPWTATTNVGWISLSSPSGTGSGSVGFTVAANTGASRAGIITAGGIVIGISQAGPLAGVTCTVNINPTSQSTPAAGATDINVAVATTAGCAWTATSNAPWLTITSGASGSGNGTVRLNVSANTGAARTGTLTIGGRTFTVNQAAACTYSIDPGSITVGDENIQGLSVAVTATPATCSWTATSQAGWIAIVSGTSGTGNGSVTYAVSDFGGTSRTGTMTIAGQIFTVTQVRCSATVNPTTQDVTALGGSFSFAVTTQVGCGWAASENLDWITITNAGGGRVTGSGTVQYFVSFNAGAGRTGIIVAAGHAVTVNQAELIP